MVRVEVPMCNSYYCFTRSSHLQYIFKDVELIVHIDNDVIFLNELSDIWQHAHKMNQSQMFAMAPDFLDINATKQLNFEYPLDIAPSTKSIYNYDTS